MKGNRGHSTFHGKVSALVAKGFLEENARRIVGAEVQHARGKMTAREKAALKRARRKGKRVLQGLFPAMR